MSNIGCSPCPPLFLQSGWRQTSPPQGQSRTRQEALRLRYVRDCAVVRRSPPVARLRTWWIPAFPLQIERGPLSEMYTERSQFSIRATNSDARLGYRRVPLSRGRVSRLFADSPL